MNEQPSDVTVGPHDISERGKVLLHDPNEANIEARIYDALRDSYERGFAWGREYERLMGQMERREWWLREISTGVVIVGTVVIAAYLLAVNL